MRIRLLAISIVMMTSAAAAASQRGAVEAGSVDYRLGDCDAAGVGEGRGEVDVLACLDAAAARQSERLRRLETPMNSSGARRVQRQWPGYLNAQCAADVLDVADWGSTYRNQALLECRAVLTSDRAAYLDGRAAAMGER